MTEQRIWKRVIMALLGLLVSPAMVTAQDGPNTGKLSFSGGVDWTNAYFFRGMRAAPCPTGSNTRDSSLRSTRRWCRNDRQSVSAYRDRRAGNQR